MRLWARFRRACFTLLRASEDSVTSTAATGSGSGSVGGGTLGTSVALAGALNGLVDDLGRRFRLSVGVELRVVAWLSSWLEGSSGDHVAILRYPEARKGSTSKNWVSMSALR